MSKLTAIIRCEICGETLYQETGIAEGADVQRVIEKTPNLGFCRYEDHNSPMSFNLNSTLEWVVEAEPVEAPV
jgi:hypothetical protein